MSWLAERLASHGIITIAFTPTNNRSGDARVWQVGHEGSLEKLNAETSREGSPIKGAIDLSKLGIMGFSMGGAGTILAANQLGDAIKVAVPLCAYRPVSPTMKSATLYIAGTRDTISIPGRIVATYEAMPENTPSALANFNGLRHQDILNNGNQHDHVARYIISWYRFHMNQETAYQTYLSGEKNLADLENPQVFANTADYQIKGGAQ